MSKDIYHIVADAGSTKTAWALGTKSIVYTTGLNPAVMTRDEIASLLDEQLLPAIAREDINVTPACCIHFYGAGCKNEPARLMQELLQALWPQASIEVGSDMLGAARALLGSHEGLACILGTGENTCYYDGHDITAHIPPLGYILGDEGSGAHLGRTLIAAIFKHHLPAELEDAFQQQYALTEAELIEHTYKRPAANSFLASFVPFIVDHATHPSLQMLVHGCFEQFITQNILPYRNILHQKCPTTLHFVGSIAHLFQAELQKAATLHGFNIGQVLQAPIDALAGFHNSPSIRNIVSKR